MSVLRIVLYCIYIYLCNNFVMLSFFLTLVVGVGWLLVFIRTRTYAAVRGHCYFHPMFTVFGYGGFSNIPNAQLFYTQTFELPIWNSDSDPYELCRHHVGQS